MTKMARYITDALSIANDAVPPCNDVLPVMTTPLTPCLPPHVINNDISENSFYTPTRQQYVWNSEGSNKSEVMICKRLFLVFR